MSPEEKSNMLQVIEDLMNQVYSTECEVSETKSGAKNTVTDYFEQQFPCVLWVWDGDKIVVTGYEQKEIKP